MIRNMLASALVAGCAAWLVAAVLHFAFVQDYILLGEKYESGALTHFAGGAPAGEAGEGHTHSEGEAAHDHAANDNGADDPGQTRDFWTVVFFGLVYVGYALILVAGFGLAQAYGRSISAREGLLWGIAGFAAFQLAPAMGLAPELPGTIAADLAERQVWWWATVACTAAGLALLGYGRSLATAALALGLLAAPHVVGAPEIDGFYGTAPPEVAAAFSARVLGVALAVWAVMGWVAGYVWNREIDKSA